MRHRPSGHSLTRHVCRKKYPGPSQRPTRVKPPSTCGSRVLPAWIQPACPGKDLRDPGRAMRGTREPASCLSSGEGGPAAAVITRMIAAPSRITGGPRWRASNSQVPLRPGPTCIPWRAARRDLRRASCEARSKAPSWSVSETCTPGHATILSLAARRMPKSGRPISGKPWTL
jgi:hypothetical protein